MILYILFIQRKERYVGEYGIEAVEVMDEYSYADNPDYLNDKLKEYRDQKDIDEAKIISVTINEQEIQKILYPTKIIKGTIEKQGE
jgi:hypothetical protein